MLSVRRLPTGVRPTAAFSPPCLPNTLDEDPGGKHLVHGRVTHIAAQGTESQMLGLLIVPCEKLAPWVDGDITCEN